MSFSSFKDTKLIFESFRKFTNEAEEDGSITFDDDDDFDIDIPEPSEPREPVTRAALDAAEAEREQKAAELAARRAARASKRQAEMDAAFPDDDNDGTLPDEQAASPQQKVQRAYIAARRSLGREGTESSGIARAMTMLADDPAALEALKAMVSGDEDTGYRFVDVAKPQPTTNPAGAPPVRAPRSGRFSR